MIKLDINKIISAPKDEWEAISSLLKREQELIEALHIMESIINYNGEEFKEIHEKKIKDFLSKFKKP